MTEGQHGGYRRPTNPAPVSGPGRLSRRTDGRQPTRDLPGAKYGENAAFREAQQAAPMSGDIGSGGMAARPGDVAAAAGPDLSALVPLDAPTQRPDEPITAGLSGGPGAGPRVPNAPSPLSQEQRERLKSYMPALIVLASREDADPHTRQFVRQLRADL